jgi:hypothetical protein
VYGETLPLLVAAWHAPGEPVPVAEGLAAEYQPFDVGAAWGRPWGTTWFCFAGKVPAEWAGRDVEAVIDLGWGDGSFRSSEREKFLKVAFPIDVRADRSAAETQFGHVFRPTHINTSWEAAKFEICAHRFLHVGEPGWGAALVNDSILVTRPPDPTSPTARSCS